MAETIIAAAVRFEDNIYAPAAPARHGEALDMAFERHGSAMIGNEDQGFLTSKKRFVDRLEAAEIAMNAGQIEAPRYGPELFSEDLW